MVSLELIKHQLNIDMDYTEDDTYLLQLCQVAENAVIKELDLRCPEQMLDEQGEIKADIQHAILLLVGSFYANREAVTYGLPNKLPYAFQYLLDLNHDYSYKNYHCRK